MTKLESSSQNAKFTPTYRALHQPRGRFRLHHRHWKQTHRIVRETLPQRPKGMLETKLYTWTNKTSTPLYYKHQRDHRRGIAKGTLLDGKTGLLSSQLSVVAY